MDFKLKRLPNGVRLITIPAPSLASATVTFWVGTGSRNEKDEVAGISHFLEHMVFKGGAKRETAKEIAEAVDAIGGEFNAATSKEWTNFYIKSRAENVDTAFDVLADMVLFPALREEDIKREKGVIIEEMGMYEDTPLWKIEDYFEELVFAGHPLGRDVIGTKKSVRNITRNDFVKYRLKYYVAENIIITVAGGVTEAKALSLTKKYFGDLAKISAPAAARKFTPKQKSPALALSNKQKDQAHIMIGFRSSPYGSPMRFTENVLATVLGGGMSSRLFTEIREKRGLAYSVRASRDTYTDTGVISIYAGVDPKKAEEAVKVILDECYSLAAGENPVTEEELSKTKEYLKGHLALSLEDTKAMNSFFGLKELLLGRLETPEEYFKKIDEVTISDVQSAAKKYFVPAGLNLAVIGPFKNKSKFEKILGK